MWNIKTLFFLILPNIRVFFLKKENFIIFSDVYLLPIKLIFHGYNKEFKFGLRS